MYSLILPSKWPSSSENLHVTHNSFAGIVAVYITIWNFVILQVFPREITNCEFKKYIINYSMVTSLTTIRPLHVRYLNFIYIVGVFKLPDLTNKYLSCINKSLICRFLILITKYFLKSNIYHFRKYVYEKAWTFLDIKKISIWITVNDWGGTMTSNTQLCTHLSWMLNNLIEKKHISTSINEWQSNSILCNSMPWTELNGRVKSNG